MVSRIVVGTPPAAGRPAFSSRIPACKNPSCSRCGVVTGAPTVAAASAVSAASPLRSALSCSPRSAPGAAMAVRTVCQMTPHSEVRRPCRSKDCRRSVGTVAAPAGGAAPRRRRGCRRDRSCPRAGGRGPRVAVVRTDRRDRPGSARHHRPRWPGLRRVTPPASAGSTRPARWKPHQPVRQPPGLAAAVPTPDRPMPCADHTPVLPAPEPTPRQARAATTTATTPPCPDNPAPHPRPGPSRSPISA